jgi:Uma2 family endonuclease
VRDRGVKRQLYQRHGVGEYWIVDTQNLVIERWQAAAGEPTLHDAQLEWQPPAEVSPLVIDLDQLFAKLPAE